MNKNTLNSENAAIMRKLKLSIFLFISLFNITYSQEWIWSKQISSNAETQLASIELDGENNVYISGIMNADVEIGAPASLLRVGTTINFYIAKFNESGIYQWHKQIAGTGDISRGKLEIDNTDSIIFCAFYKGQCDSLPGVLPSYNATKADILLAKYGSNGELGWSKRVAWGPGDVKSQEFTVDPNNNIYITGFANDTVYFENNNVITTTAGRIINFIVKFNSQGEFVNVTKINFTSTNVNNNKFIGVTAPNENEIYAAGFFTDSVKYGSIKLYSGGTTTENMLLMKLDSDGEVVWMRMGGSSTGNDRCYGVTTDIYGNVYMTGYISYSATFDSTGNGSQNSSPLLSAGLYDMAIVKYNKNGTLLWKRSNGNTGEDIGYGIYISRNLLMYSGYYAGTVSFNNSVLNSGSITNSNTGFFVYDTDGNPITAHDIQGNAADRGENITYDNSGRTYIGGYFLSTDLTIGNQVYNCGGTQDGFLAVYQNPFSVTFGKHENIKCYGDNTGSLIATPYFGAAPYTYSWSTNVTSFNDSLAYNLVAGTYSVTVTDSRDSTATTSIILSQPDEILIDATQSSISCYPTDGISNNGSIDLTVSGGTVESNYTYNWQAIQGSGVNAISEDQNSLTAGTYAVYVRDDNLCMASDTFYLSQPEKITYTGSSSMPETVPPGSNGEISLAVNGGTGVLDLDWDGPSGFNSTLADLIDLEAGSYTVNVQDDNGCTSDTTFFIPNNVMLIAYISDKNDVNCFGIPTGSATVRVINGTGPYDYHWENNLGTTININDSTIFNVPADIYHVTVTDNGSGGTTATASTTILGPTEALSANVVMGAEVGCFGDHTGIADLTVNGGTLPYMFDWSTNSTEEDLLDLPAGDYSVTVTDENGCTASDNITFGSPDPMAIILTIEQPVMCFGDATGRVTALATGGTGMKTYLWDDPGNQTAATATSLLAGVYNCTATDINGCEVEESIELIEPAVLRLTETHQNVSCAGLSTGVINLSVLGGTPSYNYEWSNGQISQDISGLDVNTYEVIVTDSRNCSADTSITITEPPLLVIDNVQVDANSITVDVSGGTPPYEYSLDGSGLNTTGSFTNVLNGTHSVSVTDANSCGPVVQNNIIVDYIGINIFSENTLKIYPNPSDGIFYLEFIGTEGIEIAVEIFNSSGSLVYKNTIEINDQKVSIDLSKELNGLYFMKINGNSSAIKLIVN